MIICLVDMEASSYLFFDRNPESAKRGFKLGMESQYRLSRFAHCNEDQFRQS